MFDIDLNKYVDLVIEVSVLYAPRVILALLTLVVGFLMTSFVVRFMEKILQSERVERSLRGFLESLVSVFLKILVVIAAAGVLGVQMASFIAVIGAAGLAVGLALQGSLSNFAGGVLILFFKPFKVGDLIEAKGYLGHVTQIQIFATILKTLDNRTVVVPNGELSNGAIMNYSTEDHLRVDMVFGVGYEDNFEDAKKVLKKIIDENDKIIRKDEATVAVFELGASSVDIACRVWTKKENYWDVYFALNEAVKKAFDEHNLSIPYPQRDVHLYQKS